MKGEKWREMKEMTQKPRLCCTSPLWGTSFMLLQQLFLESKGHCWLPIVLANSHLWCLDLKTMLPRKRSIRKAKWSTQGLSEWKANQRLKPPWPLHPWLSPQWVKALLVGWGKPTHNRSEGFWKVLPDLFVSEWQRLNSNSLNREKVTNLLQRRCWEVSQDRKKKKMTPILRKENKAKQNQKPGTKDNRSIRIQFSISCCIVRLAS